MNITISPSSLRLVIGLMSVAILLQFPITLLDEMHDDVELNISYSFYSDFLTVIQCVIYIYNLWFFRKLLLLKFNYDLGNRLVWILTLYLGCAMIIYMTNDASPLLAVMIMVFSFATVPFGLNLLRTPVSAHAMAIRLIGAIALITLAVSYIDTGVMVSSMDGKGLINGGAVLLYSIEDATYIYLYILVLKDLRAQV